MKEYTEVEVDDYVMGVEKLRKIAHGIGEVGYRSPLQRKRRKQ